MCFGVYLWKAATSLHPPNCCCEGFRDDSGLVNLKQHLSWNARMSDGGCVIEEAAGDTMGTNELSSKTVWLSASKDALCNVWLQGGRAASRELFCKQRPFLRKQPGHANTTSNRLGGAALEQDNGGSFQCVSGTKRLHTAAFITEEDTKTKCFWASLARQEVGHAEFFKI